MHPLTLTPASPTVRVDVMLADGSVHTDSEHATEAAAWERWDVLSQAGFHCRVVGASIWGCCCGYEEPPVEVTEAEIQAALDFGKTAEQHLPY